MTSDAEDPIELLRLGDEKAPIVISLSKFKGMRFIDIRRYYFDKTSKTTKPTPKGIALKEDEFELITQFLTGNTESLRKLFTSNLNTNELTFRGTTLEKKARKKAASSAAPASYALKNWPALEFFNVDDFTTSSVVNFNKKIKVIAKLEQSNPDFLNHLKDIVIAYHTAKNSLHFSSKQKPADILELIEIEWARNLNVQQ
ncbi:MAG: hypothetical protein BWK72_19495 [Rhodoferax ferrireducens]|uniref:Transcriptional coactivator p15 (PC4) C-terminal domain-containing protein n=1 Tax=Rhodoferax ferrireducens TaxID=192843 RepID=A0A1W9KPA3_9BURK|nr:MAG: hypothetical protein BWK72_19495 [Rhodoferax ferrireducens]